MGEVINLSHLTARYIGRPFEESSCMGLLYDVYTDIGVKVPSQFGGLDLDSYFLAWEKDKRGTIAVMLDLFQTLGAPVVDLSRLKRFDLLAVEETNGDKKNIYPAIFTGNRMALTSNLTQGVRMFHIGQLHRVLMARRFDLCRK